ncbi:MAG TPA: choice-of-anchor Q domain-containing protein [Rudaea sp.]|jgi:hypothetical protein
MRRLIDGSTVLIHGIVAVALAAAACDARATVRLWPGASPCDTTLQACIDGSANDDTIQVQSNGPIQEDLQVGKPLSLVAAAGYRPVFDTGFGISAYYSPGAGIAWSMTFDGLSFLQGGIGVRSYSGDANITFSRLDVNAVIDSYVGGAVGIDNFGSGHLTYTIQSNRIRLNEAVGLDAIIVTSNNGSTFDGSIHDNRIESTSPPDISDSGIVIIGTQALAPDVRVYANQVTGNVAYGISVWVKGPSKLTLVDNMLRSTTTNSFGIPLTLTAGAGITLDAEVFNNTIAGFGQGFLGNGAGISGRLSGNLFAYSATLAIHQQSSTLTEDHSLFFANGGPAPVLGTGSMIADPKFARGIDDMRLIAGSPAIDAADSAALTTLLANESIGQIDADGSRRFKGATSLADIGAFEFGDGRLIELATDANEGLIDNPLLNGNSAALPQLVQDLNPDTYVAPAYDPGMTALLYSGSNFEVTDEDGTAPTANSAYNVFAPASGTGTFLHTSGVANIQGFTTRVDNPYLNGQGGRIVLATHRATAGTLFNHPLGIAFGYGYWFIAQLDGQEGVDFASGLGFDVYAQDPSLNAFVWTAPAAGTSTAIDHLLLNDEPCGRVYVTNGILNLHPIGVKYAQNRWTIINLDLGSMPQGAEFQVVVDEAATQFCRYDHLYHNGFDGS